MSIRIFCKQIFAIMYLYLFGFSFTLFQSDEADLNISAELISLQ
jgi:hypothetical protein